jgi:ABC-2 type transport system permease protein
MIDLIGAEFLKLRSTRTALGMFIAAVLVSVGPAILIMALVHRDMLSDGGTSAAAAAGLTLVPILAVVFGVLGMTNEYRHGTITYTYLVTPRRGLVMLIKLFCYALVGAAVMVVTGLLTVAAIGAVAAIRNVHVPWLEASTITSLTTVRDLALFLMTVGLMTAFGVGLGALFRAQVPTVAGVLVWALVVEGIIGLVSRRVAMYLPFSAFQQLNFGEAQGSEALKLTRPEAFLVSVAYIAAVSVAAVYLSMRRDVT